MVDNEKPHFKCGGLKISKFYSLKTYHVVAMRHIIDNLFEMIIFYVNYGEVHYSVSIIKKNSSIIDN